MRLPNDYGDGRSTLIFGEFVRHQGGRLYTVDIEPRHIVNCRKVTRRLARRISYHVGDSIEFLRSLARDRTLNRIDLLYLDSFDYALGIEQEDERLASQRHCLAELEAALPLLSPHALVLIDDADLIGGGKPALAKRRLLELGWALLVEDYQVLFASPKSVNA
jgi:predicted O-methyltransferase YrrM